MVRHSRSRIVAVITLAISVSLGGPAFADAIDGDWCNGAQHFEIQGSTIVTPARNKLDGQYYRYRFTYIVPANEPGAGGEVAMVMVRGQEVVHLKRPGQTGDPEIWRRCKPVS